MPMLPPSSNAPFCFTPPPPTGLDATILGLQAQAKLVLEALILNPNQTLADTHRYLVERIAELGMAQKECAIANQQTAQHNDAEWTKRHQSNNCANVEVVRAHAQTTQQYYQQSFSTQMAWSAGHHQSQQVFAQNLPAVISAFGTHPDVISEFTPRCSIN